MNYFNEQAQEKRKFAMTDPNEIQELITLDRVLLENEFGIDAYTTAHPRFCLHYYFENPFGPNYKLGKAFQEATERLVPAAGGAISGGPTSNGYVAAFPTEEARTKFLKAFSNVAGALNEASKPKPTGEVYISPSQKIRMTIDGFTLGI
jgi:hypothetical protein